MTTDERSADQLAPDTAQQDEKITDLPAAPDGGEDGEVKGGRITNLRGNASAIGSGAAGLPNQVIA